MSKKHYDLSLINQLQLVDLGSIFFWVFLAIHVILRNFYKTIKFESRKYSFCPVSSKPTNVYLFGFFLILFATILFKLTKMSALRFLLLFEKDKSDFKIYLVYMFMHFCIYSEICLS